MLRNFADSELELVSVLTKGYCPLEVSLPSRRGVKAGLMGPHLRYRVLLTSSGKVWAMIEKISRMKLATRLR